MITMLHPYTHYERRLLEERRRHAVAALALRFIAVAAYVSVIGFMVGVIIASRRYLP
jgi:hypothetical protein